MSEATTAAHVAELHERLSNWGLWGDEDQLGTLNLITPEKRAHGPHGAGRGAPRLTGALARA